MSPTIPFAIHRRIIGFLWRDRGALCCCARVCKAWLHPSRFYLFCLIDLKDLPTFDNLAQIAMSTSPLLEYFQYTQELIIRANPDSPARSDQPPNGTTTARPRQWAHVAPLLFSAKMLHLTLIEYFGIDWTKTRVPRLFYVCKFASVTQLRLSDCKFPSFTQVQLLTGTLPKVSALELRGVVWDKPDSATRNEVHNSGPRLLSLTTQEISRPNFTSIVEWISDSPSRELLRVLRCLCDDRERSFIGVDTTRLLKVLGASLEDLSIDLTNWEFAESGTISPRLPAEAFYSRCRHCSTANIGIQHQFAIACYLLPHHHGSRPFSQCRGRNVIACLLKTAASSRPQSANSEMD